MDLLKVIYQNFLAPGFMQGMVLCTAVFLLPLEHRPGWKRKFGISAVLFFLLAGWIDYGHALKENGLTQPGAFLAALLFLGVFVLPFVVSYFLFRICSRISPADCVYAVACSYAVQHTAFCLATAISGGRLSTFHDFLLTWCILLLALLITHSQVAKQLTANGHYYVSRQKAFMVLFMMLLIGMVLNYPLRLVASAWNSYVYLLCLAYDVICCVFLLWLQVEQRREIELAVLAMKEEHVRRQMQEQYELRRENIELINQKCHDLKHQISALRQITSADEREESIRDIENSVMIYDSSVKTGNPVLDTLLTEKSLYCEQHNISWTCMADGEPLNQIPTVDLYTLLGNALDNAIESSLQIEDPAMRNVSVVVQKKFGSAFIQIENYFEQPRRKTDRGFLTTKADTQNHGFGLQSMKRIAEKYNGSLDASTQDNIFILSILIPLK